MANTSYKNVTAAKMAEADELMAKAGKALKTTLFAWKVNHTAAADSFESAAQLYTNIDCVDAARHAWRRAAQERLKARDATRAARCFASLAAYLHDRATVAREAYRKQVRDDSRRGGGGGGKVDHAAVRAVSEQYTEAVYAYEEAAKVLLSSGNGARAAQHMLLAAHVANLLATHELQRQPQQQQQQHTPTTTTVSTTTVSSSSSKPGSNAPPSSTSSADQLYRRLAHEAVAATERAWEVGEGSGLHALPDVYNELTLYLLHRGDAVAAVQAMKRSLGIAASAPQQEPLYVESKNVYMQLQQPANAAKTGLEIVVVCLGGSTKNRSSGSGSGSGSIDRVAWAHDEMATLRRVSGFAGSNEQVAANALLAAFDDRDAAQLAQALRDHTCLRFIRAEVSRIALQLRIDDGATHVGDSRTSTAATLTKKQQQQQQQQQKEEEKDVRRDDGVDRAASAVASTARDDVEARACTTAADATPRAGNNDGDDADMLDLR